MSLGCWYETEKCKSATRPIPLIAEQRDPAKSFYETHASYSLFGMRSLPVKKVCFPQHVLFIIGIVLYMVGTCWKAQ
jgi:hypothetical protein